MNTYVVGELTSIDDGFRHGNGKGIIASKQFNQTFCLKEERTVINAKGIEYGLGRLQGQEHRRRKRCYFNRKQVTNLNCKIYSQQFFK